MAKKNLLEEANRISKSDPVLRGGITKGLQLILQTQSLTDEQKEEIERAIEIVSGLTSYVKSVKRPAEIDKLERQVDEDEEEERNPSTLPTREETKAKEEEKKSEPKPEVKEKEEKKPEVKRKPIIRRPWDNDDEIGRPSR